MLSSGTSAVSTDSNDAETLITVTAAGRYRLTIVNEGSVAGFWSPNGGTTYARLPAGPSSVSLEVYLGGNVLIKRITDGSNVTNVYGWAEPL